MKTDFYKPMEIAEAVDLLEQFKERAKIVNGGTDIVEKITAEKIFPEAVIYVGNIQEMKKIEERDGNIVLGGGVTYVSMLHSDLIRRSKGLMEAVRHLGSPGIRRVATPAGNIGTGAPSADCLTMLIGLEAKAVLVSAEGERTVPVEEFFLGTYKTVLKPNELIKEITFPSLQKGTGTGYIRLARRKAQDIAKVLVSAKIYVEEGKCKSAVIGLGALNATAVRGISIEDGIKSKGKEEALSYVRENFPKEAGLRPSRFTHYKELVTCVAVERAVKMAWEEAEEVK